MSAKSGRVLFKALVVVVLLGAVGVGVVYYLRPVAKVDIVRRGDIADIVSGDVVVDAERVSSITSEVEGKVKESHLDPGKSVKEGELLVQLDTTDIDLTIEQAQNELNAAKKNQEIALETAKLQWITKDEEMKAVERLHKDEKMSEQDFARSKRDFEMAKQARAKAEADDQSRIDSLENSLKVAQRKKEKMTINAPFDGTITSVSARKNDLIGAKDSLAQIIADTQRVKARISEESFPKVEVGQKARVTLRGYGTQIFNATVTQKLPAAEADNQRYIAYLKVDLPPDRKLLPNLTGEVGIILGERKNVVRVPRRAMWDGYVFVVEGGRAVEHKIDMGYLDYNFTEVKSGVKEGDVIIAEEVDRFENGDRIRTQPVSSAP